MAREFIRGIAIGNFRGIGDQLQLIGPFQSVNFFLGPNNSGKSTVLLFLSRYLNPENRQGLREQWARTYDPLDIRLGKNESEVRFAVAGSTNAIDVELEALLDSAALANARKVLDFVADGALVWLEPNEKRNGLTFVRKPPEDLLDGNSWQRLWMKLTTYTGGGSARENWIPNSLSRLTAMAAPSLPAVSFIPAIREIGPKGEEYKDLSGRGLIDHLAEFQSPAHNEQQKKRTFEAINEFVRTVTQSNDATIEIPFDRRHILVHMDGRVLPISALGTGIQEVIMIAAFCTMQQDKAICIEEPEIHLHPLLQRRLMTHLLEHTSNQYFIATHSAALVDACPASVFQVSLEDSETRIALVTTSIQRFEICRQLGYRASDILQVNAVIWVEGPTDRIYINHWLQALDSELREGVDYSIMFYGGRLLSHVTAADEDLEQFVSLLRLNRNTAIVIDSDKSSSARSINATKQRIVSENAAGLTWVTDGREIENYLGSGDVTDFLINKYGLKFERVIGVEKYSDRLAFKLKGEGGVRQADKVELAKFVSKRPANFAPLGLRQRIEELTKFVREAVL